VTVHDRLLSRSGGEVVPVAVTLPEPAVRLSRVAPDGRRVGGFETRCPSPPTTTPAAGCPSRTSIRGRPEETVHRKHRCGADRLRRSLEPAVPVHPPCRAHDTRPRNYLRRDGTSTVGCRWPDASLAGRTAALPRREEPRSATPLPAGCDHRGQPVTVPPSTDTALDPGPADATAGSLYSPPPTASRRTADRRGVSWADQFG
jgi:hypothetical protein